MHIAESLNPQKTFDFPGFQGTLGKLVILSISQSPEKSIAILSVWNTNIDIIQLNAKKPHLTFYRIAAYN